MILLLVCFLSSFLLASLMCLESPLTTKTFTISLLHPKATSTGSCVQVCPEVFEVRSDGYRYILQENPGDELRETVEQAAEWKAHVQREFSLWADSTESDWEQTLTFYEQQAVVLRGTLESGDLFTLLPNGDRTPTQP